MRVIQGHDYYDSALAYGQDDQILFVREKNHVLTDGQADLIPGCVKFVPALYFHHKRGVHNNHYAHVRTSDGDQVQVQGVSAWVAQKCWRGYQIKSMKTPAITLWSWEALESWAHAQGYSSVTTVNRNWYLPARTTPELSAGVHETPAQMQQWMIQNGVTILTHTGVNPTCWCVNGTNLKDLQLYKVCDAHSMFQIISQWVGGVLPGHTHDMVQITDDKIKAHKHGFDKHSFRKLPHKTRSK
jgi:hypothetical protein